MASFSKRSDEVSADTQIKLVAHWLLTRYLCGCATLRVRFSDRSSTEDLRAVLILRPLNARTGRAVDQTASVVCLRALTYSVTAGCFALHPVDMQAVSLVASDPQEPAVFGTGFAPGAANCLILPVLNGPDVHGPNVAVRNAAEGQPIGTVLLEPFSRWEFWRFQLPARRL